jgi:hypothetical protein
MSFSSTVVAAAAVILKPSFFRREENQLSQVQLQCRKKAALGS